jgi:hypothetical protein
MVSDEIQILDYTHIVFLGIAILKFQEMLTRIFIALKTEFQFVLVNQLAMLL